VKALLDSLEEDDFMNLKTLLFSCAIFFSVSCKNEPVQSRSYARLSSCAAQSFRALQQQWPATALAPDALEIALEFDCRESEKIKALNQPVATANSAMGNISKLVQKIPSGFVKDSVEVLQPYCRSDNDLYGPFCMAADVDAAYLLSEDQELLKLLPQAVHALGQEISTATEIDFNSVLQNKLPALAEKRNERIALLAGFLGLDDNAVQADRLKANLLKQNRMQEYALVFPALTQYTVFPAQGDKDYGRDFLAVLFSTRTGLATLPGVAEGETQTYKAYAGFHLGCRMAQLGRSSQLAEAEAYNMGYAYQMTKLAARLRKPIEQFIADAKKLHLHGKNTGDKMKAGARHGHQVCSTQ
jgi:hypothetical protein